MATNNRYRYWGNWGLPMRGVMGRVAVITGVLLGAVKATVRALRWQGTVTSLRWRGEVKKRGG